MKSPFSRPRNSFSVRCGMLALLVSLTGVGAYAQDAYLGEIRMFAGNFEIRGWAFCNGQLLSIAQNQALFSLLGTTYGGDGQTTFALPDLRGRFPMHPGTGPGLTPRSQGETGGTETVTLTTAQLPAHNHTATVSLAVDTTVGTTAQPRNGLPARNASATPQYGTQANGVLAAGSTVQVGVTGSGLPQDNMPPFNTVQFIIALQGIFPSRN